MKIIDSLFRPKLIGKYINEHIMHSIIYFILFVLLCAVPSVASALNTPNLTYSSQISLIEDIKSKNETNIKIVDNKLISNNEKCIFVGDGVSVAFNTNEVEDLVVFSFSETTYTLYYGGYKVKTVEYSSMENSNLDVSLIQTGEITMIYQLFSILNVGYDELLKTAIPVYCLESIFMLLIEFAIVFVIILVFGAKFNPAIPAKFRTKVAIYSLTWTFVLYFIGINIGLGWLYYIGLVVSFIFNAKALRNLIRVERIK